MTTGRALDAILVRPTVLSLRQRDAVSAATGSVFDPSADKLVGPVSARIDLVLTEFAQCAIPRRHPLQKGICISHALFLRRRKKMVTGTSFPRLGAVAIRLLRITTPRVTTIPAMPSKSGVSENMTTPNAMAIGSLM
jgi:hypothetical protein